ncbi:hypothetical protein [Silvibacterium sp.]|uniref:hypothetical protein n=1 Tax=Silvibacterium sp. TaxID=1964179 RepID=UPI0039E4754F
MASSLRRVAGVMLMAAAVLVAGCETGRTNKQAFAGVRDDTTTGKQDPALVASGDGQPPVPGSPTAAGADGKQPYDDTQARADLGAEEGKAPPPAAQGKDAFQRQ